LERRKFTEPVPRKEGGFFLLLVMKILKDQYQRTINYLRISVTDRCNLRCQYCMPEEGIPLIDHGDILRYEEILRLVRVAAQEGITKVRITGGEPLVRKGIVNFINELSAVPGIKDLSMTTNGVLLKDFAQPLKLAGLKRINISLDTLDQETFFRITRRDKFHDVRAGIMEALNVGFSPVKLNVVIIKGTNEKEVLDFARLTIQFPLVVRFIEYMPAGENQWKPELVYFNSRIKEQIQELGALVSLLNEKNDGPAVRYRFKNSLGEIGFINPISDHFCHLCNRIRLTPDGHLRTCLLHDEEIDLKPFLRGGSDDEKLREVFLHALEKKPKQHYLEEAHFKKCQRTMSALGG
jgi:GTP 3',8-cyclase